jgi:LCP family protein required for cell wall assembly
LGFEPLTASAGGTTSTPARPHDSPPAETAASIDGAQGDAPVGDAALAVAVPVVPGPRELGPTEPGLTEPDPTEPGVTEPGSTGPGRVGPRDDEEPRTVDQPAAQAGEPEAAPSRTGPEAAPSRTGPEAAVPRDAETGSASEKLPRAGLSADLPSVSGLVTTRRRAPRWSKILITVGAILVLLSGGAIAGLKTLTQRYERSVHRAALLDPEVRTQPTPDSGPVPNQVAGPLNFLLLGSDARDKDPSNGQRSDTIILVHVPATMDRAYLISIPRDLRVEIPAFPDNNFAGSTEKINAAFNYGGGGVGGYQLLSKTLHELIGVTFDGAAIINFDGFQSAVSLLGGVDMCIDERTVSIHTGFVYQPGCQHLAPWQALDYVRQRETLPNGDYDRQRHQQQFLKAIFTEALSRGVATDPIKLDRLIRAVGNSLTVDTNGTDLADLVFSLKNIQPSAVVGIRLPSYPTMIGNTSYVLPYDTATSLYEAVASDTLDAWVAANGSWVNST